MSKSVAARVVVAEEAPAISPALDRLARVTHEVCIGMIRDRLQDVVLVLDEATYQAARILRTEGAVDLPNIGRLEIRYGDDGPVGRFIPSEDLHPLAAAAD